MEKLVKALQKARVAESVARWNRTQAEEALEAAFKAEQLEGGTTRIIGNYKVTVTKKLTRQLDSEAFEAMGLAGGEFDFTATTRKIVLRKLREVESINPKLVAELVTIRPAKTSIVIDEIEEV